MSTATSIPAVNLNTSSMDLEMLGKTIKHRIYVAETHSTKAEDNYKSAGLLLLEARKRVEAGEYKDSPHFSHYLQSYCPMSSSRAYELIAIATGATTIEASRARAAQGMQATRAKRATSSQEASDMIRQAREFAEAMEANRKEARAKNSQSFRNITEKQQPTDSVQKNVKQPNNLGGRPVVDQLAHLRTLISKQAKLMQSKEQLVQALELITKLNN